MVDTQHKFAPCCVVYLLIDILYAGCPDQQIASSNQLHWQCFL